MKVSALKYLIILTACGMTGCSMELFPQRDVAGRPVAGTRVVKQTTMTTAQGVTRTPLDNNVPTAVASSGGSVGGHGMDSLDRSKLSHALDNPIGKATQWSNDSTGARYTVVPIEKVTVNGNTYCRRYKTTISSKSGNVQESQGVACVGADGNWQSV